MIRIAAITAAKKPMQTGFKFFFASSIVSTPHTEATGIMLHGISVPPATHMMMSCPSAVKSFTPSAETS